MLLTPARAPCRGLALGHATRLCRFVSQAGNSGSSDPTKSAKTGTILDDLRAHAENVKSGSVSSFDDRLLPPSDAKIFPRIKTTSLSTKRIVITDEAAKKPATLVLVAFRNSADDQLQGWRDIVRTNFADQVQWFDVTVNESFAAQALSGFVQKWQRGRTDPAHHDFYVAFNSKAREPLESIMLSTNRLYCNALLLDRNARVRFRAAGPPSENGRSVFVKACQNLLHETS